MAQQNFDPHHEEKFEYPLMKLIREYAKTHHVSIRRAAKAVTPDYAMALKWRDEENTIKLRDEQREYIAKNSPNSLLRQFDKKD